MREREKGREKRRKEREKMKTKGREREITNRRESVRIAKKEREETEKIWKEAKANGNP